MHPFSLSPRLPHWPNASLHPPPANESAPQPPVESSNWIVEEDFSLPWNGAVDDFIDSFGDYPTLTLEDVLDDGHPVDAAMPEAAATHPAAGATTGAPVPNLLVRLRSLIRGKGREATISSLSRCTTLDALVDDVLCAATSGAGHPSSRLVALPAIGLRLAGAGYSHEASQFAVLLMCLHGHSPQLSVAHLKSCMQLMGDGFPPELEPVRRRLLDGNGERLMGLGRMCIDEERRALLLAIGQKLKGYEQQAVSNACSAPLFVAEAVEDREIASTLCRALQDVWKGNGIHNHQRGKSIELFSYCTSLSDVLYLVRNMHNLGNHKGVQHLFPRCTSITSICRTLRRWGKAPIVDVLAVMAFSICQPTSYGAMVKAWVRYLPDTFPVCLYPFRRNILEGAAERLRAARGGNPSNADDTAYATALEHLGRYLVEVGDLAQAPLIELPQPGFMADRARRLQQVREAASGRKRLQHQETALAIQGPAQGERGTDLQASDLWQPAQAPSSLAPPQHFGPLERLQVQGGSDAQAIPRPLKVPRLNNAAARWSTTARWLGRQFPPLGDPAFDLPLHMALTALSTTTTWQELSQAVTDFPVGMRTAVLHLLNRMTNGELDPDSTNTLHELALTLAAADSHPQTQQLVSCVLSGASHWPVGVPVDLAWVATQLLPNASTEVREQAQRLFRNSIKRKAPHS